MVGVGLRDDLLTREIGDGIRDRINVFAVKLDEVDFLARYAVNDSPAESLAQRINLLAIRSGAQADDNLVRNHLLLTDNLGCSRCWIGSKPFHLPNKLVFLICLKQLHSF